jgi:tetratricopeptide (TPR) repeat protein
MWNKSGELFILFLASATILLAQPALAEDIGDAIPRYELKVRLLPADRRVEAQGTVWLSKSDSSRDSLLLLLNDTMREFRVEVLKPTASAGEATLEKKEADRGQTHWTIRPAKPIPPGEPVLLHFSYAGGEKAAFVFSLGPESSFASGLNTAWYPELKGENDRGIGSLWLTAPVGYHAISGGTPVHTAADAAESRFHFEFRRPGYFDFVIGKYSTLRGTGAFPMKILYLRRREELQEYLSGCAKVLRFLTQLYGPYPHNSFSIVEVPSEQADAADFQGVSLEGGIIVASSGFLNRPFDMGYFAHEIGHQWWGNLVRHTGTTGRNIFDEAMVQYGALRTVEHLEGAYAGEKFRRSGFGGGAQKYFTSLVPSGHDHRLMDLPPAISQDLAWTKGYLALYMLSQQVGAERFQEILHKIVREYTFKPITWDAFQRLVEASTGQDLTWFFSQWFEREGAPKWQLEWKQEGRLLVATVTQPDPLYRATLKIQVDGTNYERSTFELTLRDHQTKVSWPVAFRVREVTLDPAFEVLHWTPEWEAKASIREPYFKADAAREKHAYEEAERELEAALRNVPQPDAYGARFLYEYCLARVYFEQNQVNDGKMHLDIALESPSRDLETLPWAYYGLGLVAQATHDDGLLRFAVEAATSADSVAEVKTGAAEAAHALIKP